MNTFRVFPLPFPGELLFSLLTRFAVDHGFFLQSQISTIFNGNRRWTLSPELPHWVAEFCAALPDHHQIKDPRIALQKHTIFPAVTYFLSQENRNHAANALLGPFPFQAYTLCGLSQIKPIHSPPGMAHCYACARQDIEEYGRSYWHREHQIPGVLACWRHGSPLVYGCAHCGPHDRPPGLPQFPPPHPCRQPGHRMRLDENVRLFDSDVLWTIAKAAAEMCDGDTGFEPKPWRESARDALILLGYRERDRLSYEKIADGLTSMYGAGLNRWLLINENRPVDPFMWVRKLFDHRERSQHPLYYLLVMLLINPSPKELDSRLKLSPLDEIGQSHFEWIPTWARQLPTLLDQGLSLAEVSQQINAKKEDVGFFARRLRVIASRASDGENNKNAPTLEPSVKALEHRKKILALRDQYPNQNRSAIARKAPSAFRWLLSNDKAWVDVIIPAAKGPAEKADLEHLAVRDLRICESVEAAAQRLLSRPSLPRVTITALRAEARLQNLPRKKPHLFPLTCAKLRERSETVLQYSMRRIQHEITYLRQRHSEISNAMVHARYQLPAAVRNQHPTIIKLLVEDAGLRWIS